MIDLPKEEKMLLDSEMIFAAVSTAAGNLEEAKRMLTVFYVPDLSFSRSGISHALKRLEKHYE